MPCHSLVYPDSSENPSKICSPKHLHQPAGLVFLWLAVISFFALLIWWPQAAFAQQAALSASSISFGSVAVGSKSAVKEFSFCNETGPTLTVDNIVVGGTDPSSFSQTNNCPATLTPHAGCTISVTFAPAATGKLAATVTVKSTAVDSPQVMNLSGTGTASSAAPVVSLSSSSLSFGTQAISVTSSAKTFTLSNTGGAALSLSGLVISGTNSGDFAEVADTCGSSVAAGANCTLGVTFTPSLAGAETASLAITDDASGSPQTVALSGTGEHVVLLSWTASASSGVIGYNVLRGTTSGGESSTPLNSAPISGTTYADTSVTAGTTYYYVVEAVGADDVVSSKSAQVSATVP